MKYGYCLPVTIFLAACASTAPAPVKEASPPTRIEAAVKPALPAAGVAPSTAGSYTVKKGDTLYSIAREHQLNPRDLAAWNHLDNNHRVIIGQILRLAPASPGGGSPEAAGIEVRPITGSGAVVARPLDGSAPTAPLPAAVPLAVAPPAPAADGNTERLKTSPKGGKLPYSEDNLARLKAAETAFSAIPMTSVASTVTPATEKASAEKTPVEKPPAEKSDPPLVAAPAASTELEWGWPAAGKLLSGYTEAAGTQEVSKGLDIAGKIGDPVAAAAAGKVIYVGQMNKYGNLVIVLHGGGYSSVYAHNSRILVKEGQTVTRGQKIAELGNSDADQPKLHFEIRQQGKPVDPSRFLPVRR